MIPGLLPIFLHGCEVESGSGPGRRLLTLHTTTPPPWQAVRLKEKKIASEIVAVSCGPQQCQVRSNVNTIFGHSDVCVRVLAGDAPHCSSNGCRQGGACGGSGARESAAARSGQDFSQADRTREGRPCATGEAGETTPTHTNFVSSSSFLTCFSTFDERKSR